METKGYVIARETDLSFGEAVEKARELLQEAGYGILSEIDVKVKLEEKLGIERELGALLPCDVVVCEREGRTRVAAVEPEKMLFMANVGDGLRIHGGIPGFPNRGEAR